MNQVVRRFLTYLSHRGVLVTVGVIIGAFALLNYVALPLYVRHGGTLPVPDVVGKPLAEAREMLEREGLQAVEADTRPDPDHPVGTVTSQNPLASAVVKHGRRIYLTISGGEVPVPVPMLRGRSMRDAKFALDRYGLRLGSVIYQTSDTFPQNTIIDQAVAANSLVSRGTSVGITVSQGKDIRQIKVPQVAGRSTTEAERMLLEAGLRVGNITLQPSFELLPNTVVDQFPRAGDLVPGGQAVDLFVVKAGKPSEEIHPPR